MTRLQIWTLTMGAFMAGALFGGYLLVHNGFFPSVHAGDRLPLAEHQKASRLTIEATAKIRPSVVFIGTEQTVKEGRLPRGNRLWRGPGFDRNHRYKRSGLGSGVLVQRKGDTYYILTNNHVVASADKMTVTLFNERELEAKLEGTDPNSDIAVISIQVKGEALDLAELGDSNKIRVGETVLAVGAPFGLQQTVTHGIVSAIGRENAAVANFPEFIQTDAAINPGNSGGPLVDLSGRVIGVNTWIASRSGGSQGLGFAVPITLASNVLEMIIKEGKVTRAYLGVNIADVEPEDLEPLKLESTDGCKITRVISGTPAAKAGLKANDVIVSVGEVNVTSAHSLRSLIAFKQIGSEVSMEVMRDGKKIKIKANLTDLNAIQQNALTQLGFSVEQLTPELTKEFHHMVNTGVVITGVQDNSPAARAGLARGMLILRVAGKSVKTVSEVGALLDRADLGRGVPMYVQSVKIVDLVAITDTRSILLKVEP